MLSIRQYLPVIIFIPIFALFFSACNNSDEPNEPSSDTPEPTVAQQPITQTSESNTVSSDITPVPDDDENEIIEVDQETPEAEPTEELEATEIISSDGDYYIAISYTVDESSMSDPGVPPDGTEWLLAVTTLGNQTDEAVEITADQLVLIDTRDERYSAQPVNDVTDPPLVDITLGKGESILGLVLYAVPVDRTPALLEWCIDDDCTRSVQAQIP